jgi:hypothetical protein
MTFIPTTFNGVDIQTNQGFEKTVCSVLTHLLLLLTWTPELPEWSGRYNKPVSVCPQKKLLRLVATKS